MELVEEHRIRQRLLGILVDQLIGQRLPRIQHIGTLVSRQLLRLIQRGQQRGQQAGQRHIRPRPHLQLVSLQ